MVRRIHIIWYHPRFRESYTALTSEIKQRAEKREPIFRGNPFHPLLRTHKLKGRFADLYSFSIDAKYRILFRFYRNGAIFLDIDDHAVYRA